MTKAAPTSQPDTTRGRFPARADLPAAAGLAYVLAWVVGLAAWPVNLALNATAGQASASYRAHPAEAVIQYLLVEGLAGLLLGGVLWSAVRAARERAGRPFLGPAVLSALAVVTSLAQCALGLCATAAATGGDIAGCGALTDAVNRLDGVKMLALAAVAVWLAVSGPESPRWLRAVAVALALALIASGSGYLALANALAWTAYVSGPLLLLWVAGTGVTMTRLRRRAARDTDARDTRDPAASAERQLRPGPVGS